MIEIFIGPLFLLIFVCIECLFLGKFQKVKLPWNEIIMNLNSGHILMWLFRGGELYIFYLVYTNFSFQLLDTWHYGWYFTFAFIAWDFCFYWLHRLHHKIKLLWFVHEVHHQAEHFNISLGIRNSWFSSITSVPFFLPLAFIGVNTETFLLVSSIHYFIQFYNHNAIVKHSGFLETFMITPALHKVHHAVNPEYIDKNCGGTFNIWDRIFGTYQAQLENIPIQLGLKTKYSSNNPFWINIVPFKKDKKIHEKYADNIIWFIASLLTFLHLVIYIRMEAYDTDLYLMASVFSSIFISTIAIGGIVSEKKWGFNLWLIVVFGLNWINVIVSGFDEPLLICSSAIALFTILYLIIKKHQISFKI